MSALQRPFVLIAALCASLAPAAAGGVYFDWNTSEPRVPHCDAPSVRSAVQRTFARADVEYRRGVTIEAIHKIGQTGYTRGQPSPYARRYCRARADMSDGRTRSVFYMIEEYQGFAGLTWNVETCVAGFDRWHVYDAWCRVLRP